MPKRKTATVTLSAISAMTSGDVLHDASLKGFGARRQKDAVSYFLKTRVAGRQRWVTIGRHGAPWTPDSARKRALQILANPDLADRSTPAETATVAEVIDQFVAIHGPKLKPTTLYVYQCLIRTYLMPAFGRTRVSALTRSTVSKAHASWKDNPRSANHALSVLSKVLSWAEDQGYRAEGSNPCRKIQRFKENRRERFLTDAELASLGAALDQAAAENLASLFALGAIRLLILTGARLSEILTLQWSFVDVSRRIIFLPDSKTGKKPIVLNDAALEVLQSLPRFANNPYVIVGQRHGSHLINLQGPWRTIQRLAGLEGVRLHDLRHTFASYAVGAGGSLPIIGRQLGHSQPSTTQRYAHLADDPVTKLTQSTGEAILNAMTSKPVPK